MRRFRIILSTTLLVFFCVAAALEFEEKRLVNERGESKCIGLAARCLTEIWSRGCSRELLLLLISEPNFYCGKLYHQTETERERERDKGSGFLVP